jgi:hypothetical protein
VSTSWKHTIKGALQCSPANPPAFIAAGFAAAAVAGGTYGIVNATSSSSPTAASAATPPPAFRGAGSGGSNARSGPAAGGSIGTVSDISTSGFTLVTSAGQKVTVEETSSTAYKKYTTAAAASAVTPGQTALVIGTVDSTTITAAKVILQPPASASKTVSPVVPFTRGAASTAKSVGQIPANYRQGSGTIVGGTTASKATQAALAAYPGGIADRVVRLSNGEYEVHNIGVNWPHHIFVSKNFKVLGTD